MKGKATDVEIQVNLKWRDVLNAVASWVMRRPFVVILEDAEIQTVVIDKDVGTRTRLDEYLNDPDELLEKMEHWRENLKEYLNDQEDKPKWTQRDPNKKVH